MKRTLVTSALPYANGYLHLGHCAGAYLPGDIYSRFLRLSGEEVLWVCGSDEHGVAIMISADKEKTTPEHIIDKYHYANKEAFEKFGMTFDIYSRTSNPIHHNTAKEFFADFLKKGLLNEKEEEQFFDPKANMFLPDRYVEGICPNCGHDHARGDQCDSCGAYYNQLDLKSPKSLVSGETPIVKKTIHWYMRFDLFQKFLEEYIESHSGDWKDNVLQQTRSWLKQGLNERAITRDMSWGVKIDDIPGIPKEKSTGKALYVWFEAVLGYISNTKIWALQQEHKKLGKEDDWKKWWQDDETKYIAFIGKDNIVFHTLIFPALLHAKGENYILPSNVPANEFLNLEGQKFSKSRNWSIDLRDFISDLPEPWAVDALRYTLAMNFPESKDSDFAWKDFQARNNNELASILGNFVNRTLLFIQKNFNNEMPTLPDNYKNIIPEWKRMAEFFENNKNSYSSDFVTDVFSENDKAMLFALINGRSKISELYSKFRFRDAITETMNVARAANKYFNDEEPWKTIKSDPERAAKSLYICTQTAGSLSVLFAPVIPFSCKKIRKFLSLPDDAGEPNHATKRLDFWKNCIYPLLPEGLQIGETSILFPRIEDETIAIQIAKLGDKNDENKALPAEDLITIDYFSKIKLKTAVILQAENVKKSKKLIKLQVDLGGEKKQILAGIAEHYKAEELIGKTIVIVANLQPAKLMGEESQGMLLAANSEDGRLVIVVPEKDDIGIGATVR